MTPFRTIYSVLPWLTWTSFLLGAAVWGVLLTLTLLALRFL